MPLRAWFARSDAAARSAPGLHALTVAREEWRQGACRTLPPQRRQAPGALGEPR